MKRFNRFFDMIKAEEALKEKTKEYLKKTLSSTSAINEYHRKEEEAQAIRQMNKNCQMAKKIFAAVITLTTASLLTLGLNMFFSVPISYVCIDINPSVEIGVNALDRAIYICAFNSDGEMLVDGTQIFNCTPETAVKRIVLQAAQEGFLNKDGTTVVAVTAVSVNEEKALRLEREGSNGVTDAIETGECSCDLYSACTDMKVRDEARQAGISAGKYRLIKKLQELNPDITVDKLKDSKISELIEAVEVYRNNDCIHKDKETVEATEAFTKKQNNTNNDKESPTESSTSILDKNARGITDKEKTTKGSVHDNGEGLTKETTTATNIPNQTTTKKSPGVKNKGSHRQEETTTFKEEATTTQNNPENSHRNPANNLKGNEQTVSDKQKISNNKSKNNLKTKNGGN